MHPTGSLPASLPECLAFPCVGPRSAVHLTMCLPCLHRTDLLAKVQQNNRQLQEDSLGRVFRKGHRVPADQVCSAWCAKPYPSPLLPSPPSSGSVATPGGPCRARHQRGAHQHHAGGAGEGARVHLPHVAHTSHLLYHRGPAR